MIWQFAGIFRYVFCGPLVWAFELRKVQVISCHPGSFKGIAKACSKKNVAKCHFWWRPIRSPVELGATWCWSIFRPQPGLRAPGDAETTWMACFVSAIVMVFNSQLSDFNSLNSLCSLCSYLLLPLSAKNGLATLLSVPPLLNGSETLQHVPWQPLLLLPDQWISPKRLTPFIMLSTHCTDCKPPPPPTTAATIITIIWW